MFTMIINPVLQAHYSCDVAHFEAIFHLTGEVYRAVKTRKTLRVEIDGCGYFVKLHWGTGWCEILKNILCARLPVVSAKQEYRAIRHLESIDVATMCVAMFGERYCNPAKRKSFIVTKELRGVRSLHDISRTWSTCRPSFREKQRYLRALALCVRAMHNSGLNHRDCYLVHFYWRALTQEIVVIDLHRAQIHRSLPLRWRIKDIAGLYFSSQDIGLTKRDYLRFIKHYTGCENEVSLSKKFWYTVQKKGLALYEKEKKHPRG